MYVYIYIYTKGDIPYIAGGTTHLLSEKQTHVLRYQGSANGYIASAPRQRIEQLTWMMEV